MQRHSHHSPSSFRSTRGAVFLPLLFLGGLGAGIVSLFSTTIAGVITTPFVYLFGYFLGIAGLLFDQLVIFTIVDFNTSIFGPAENGINIVWSALRAVGNISIIGIFVFIAISMILGLQSFGQRRFVAHVLIIAVLINFSLFFTRVIIEGSNLVARQFYSASLSKTNTTNPSTGVFCHNDGVAIGTSKLVGCFSSQSACEASRASWPSSAENKGKTAAGPCRSEDSAVNQIVGYASQNGISGEFMKLTGLSTAFEEGSLLSKISNSSNSGYLVLAFGAGVALLILATALVFSYAVFLLIVRAALFLILLVSSPLAFAVYLFPKFGPQYWSMWWNSLLRNAIFAPLLLMFLWGTLTIGQALATGLNKGKKATLVELFSNPTQGTGISALVIFMLITVMMFLSIRFASVFARNIAGFNVVGGVLGAAAATPLALGARLAGLGLRQTLGREYAHEAEFLGKAVELEKRRVARGEVKDSSKLDKLIRDKQIADARSRRGFEFMGTSLGKSLANKASLPNVVRGSGEATGYGTRVKEQSEAGVKKAMEAVLSDQTARGMAREEHAKKTEDLTAAHDVIKRERESLVSVQGRHEKILKDLEKEVADKGKAMQAADNDFAKSGKSPDLKSEDERIKRARDELRHAQDRMKATQDDLARASSRIPEVEKQLSDAAKAVETHIETENQQVAQLAKVFRDRSVEAASGIAARQSQGTFTKAFTKVTGIVPDTLQARDARKAFSKRMGIQPLIEQENARAQALADGGVARPTLRVVPSGADLTPKPPTDTGDTGLREAA